MDAFLNDLRHGLRLLGRNPFFAAVAALTLALGIGASTALYSVAYGVLHEPLPYDDPDRLVMVWTRFDGQGVARAPASGAEIADFWREATLFKDFAGIWPRFGSLGGEGDPEQIHIGFVTGNFFDVLGVQPFRGRSFLPEEDVPPRPSVILLAHSVWQRRYGGAEDIVGGTVEFNNESYTVVGVMPPGFEVMMPGDAGLPDFGAWLPWGADYAEMRRDWHIFRTIGRLKPGVTPEQGQAELDALAARLAEQHVDYAESGFGVVVEPLHDDIVAPVRPAILALLGAVAFVVLIACANVANLLLVRAAGRQREMAVRAALGAGRGRVTRQLVTESLVLFLIGGALGVAVAQGAIELVRVLQPVHLPRLDEIGLDPRALLFNFLIALFSGLVFGTLPAWQTARHDLTAGLRDGARATGPRRGLRGLLVVTEVALSVTLLIGAGLMLRSLAALGQVERGFVSDDVFTARMSLPFTNYPYGGPVKISGFYQQLVDRVAEIPGVEAAGTTDFPPLMGMSSAGDAYAWETPQGETEWGARSADFRIVTRDYFRAMGTRLRAGRFFTIHDDLEHPLVAVVDEKLARLAWSGEEAIGRRVKVPVFVRGTTENTWAEVVGVVEHIKNVGLTDDGREQIYLHHQQSPRRSMTLMVKSSLETAALADQARAAARAIDPSRPIFEVRPLAGFEADAVAQTRFLMWLLGVFAALAAALAAVGLYGVIAYLVRQSTRELGVRVALGASTSEILSLVLRQGLRLAAAGVAVGLVTAFAASRMMASLVYGVEVRDTVTFVTVTVLAFAVALWATWMPALQASRVDPMTALRSD